MAAQLWFLLSSFFLLLSSPQFSAVADLMLRTRCGLSANLECRLEMCCTRLAENTGRKNSPSVHRRTTLSGYIFTRYVSTIEKNVKRQYLLHMSPQYGQRRSTNGWDRFAGLGHPSTFQRLLRLVFSDLINSIQQRASSTFGWAAITLDIGLHLVLLMNIIILVYSAYRLIRLND